MLKYNVHSKDIIIVTALVVSAFYIFGDKIDVINGLGWAGSEYAVMIMTFPKSIHQFTEYHIHRALLPVTFGFIFHALDIATTPGNIRIAFIIANIVALFLSVFILYRICRLLRLTPKLSTFCFVTFIFNYAFIKFPSFYPVLTDWVATPIALLLILCWIQHRTWCLVLLGIFGTVAHPLLIFQCILLISFRYKESLRFNMPLRKIILALIYTFAASYILVGFYFAYLSILRQSLNISTALLIAGLIATSCFLLWVMYIACSCLPTTATSSTTCKPVTFLHILKNLLLAMTTLIATMFLSKLLTSSPSHISALEYFTNSFQYGSKLPFAFLISHFLYFGPAYALVIFMFRDIVRTSLSLGDAPFAFLILFSILSIDSESRHIMIFWPFVCILLTKTIADTSVSFPRKFILQLFVLSFALSQAWFPFNTFLDLSGPPEEFPAQWYFMYHGPWMTTTVYVILMFIFSATYIAYARTLKKLSGE